MKSNEQLRQLEIFNKNSKETGLSEMVMRERLTPAHWDLIRDAAIKSMEEYAQQSQPSGMRWVRASDPPKNSNPVYIRYKHAEGYAKTLGRYCNGVWEWCDTEIEAIYPEFVLTLEWLDESSPAGAAEGASEVTSDILSGLGFHAAMKQHETWWLGPIIVHFDSKWWWQIDGDFEDDDRGSDIRELKSVSQLHQIIELFT